MGIRRASCQACTGMLQERAAVSSALIYADISHLGLLSPSARHCKNKLAIDAIKSVLSCKRIFGASLK
jgi:hypothetical protein